mmetsp:Transcript_87900/g.175831  ORF Transcript_87900/g.175831 Transcript_87900/m.175831 type:complete len:212 (-) Transcript_87900:380-1015(-)
MLPSGPFIDAASAFLHSKRVTHLTSANSSAWRVSKAGLVDARGAAVLARSPTMSSQESALPMGHGCDCTTRREDESRWSPASSNTSRTAAASSDSHGSTNPAKQEKNPGLNLEPRPNKSLPSCSSTTDMITTGSVRGYALRLHASFAHCRCVPWVTAAVALPHAPQKWFARLQTTMEDPRPATESQAASPRARSERKATHFADMIESSPSR